jgi:hypothetical protein
VVEPALKKDQASKELIRTRRIKKDIINPEATKLLHETE